MNTENKEPKAPFVLGRQEGMTITITDWNASPIFLENAQGFLIEASKLKEQKIEFSKFGLDYVQDLISIRSDLESTEKEFKETVKSFSATNDTKLKEILADKIKGLEIKANKLDADYKEKEKEANSKENKEKFQEKRSKENNEKLTQTDKQFRKAMCNIIREFLIDMDIEISRIEEIMNLKNLYEGQINRCVSEIVKQKENDLIVNFSNLILSD